ncbi:hypothetical protein ZIOFF_057850 [Zingiber officinale]|uniref:Uncharacterized protein n=1 Tax=Zingiber officinale TaxID=94328 RepID=A0A8J5FD32_ZINOF|nr:hypothetical protein ZIOFF_057850 [Zingiber officinale]
MGTLGRAIYTVGFWIRETGQAIDRLGCRLQGNCLFQEQRKIRSSSVPQPFSLSRELVSSMVAKCFPIGFESFLAPIDLIECGKQYFPKHRTLMNLFDKVPNVHKDAFVAPSASIIGDVPVGQESSIWYLISNPVCFGGNAWEQFKLFLNFGHSAVLHGCSVEDEAFVGMGAVLLGVVVEKHEMVAAGSLVRQNTTIPCGQVWGGNPARFLRMLADEEIAVIAQSSTNYANLAQLHAAENAKSFDEIEFQKLLRKKFARRDEDYDSMLGIVHETLPELILPGNVLPVKARSPSVSLVGTNRSHWLTNVEKS